MNWSLTIGQVLNAVLTGAGVGMLLALGWLAGGLFLHGGRHRAHHYRHHLCPSRHSDVPTTAHDEDTS
jgi:hypothetical protein